MMPFVPSISDMKDCLSSNIQHAISSTTSEHHFIETTNFNDSKFDRPTIYTLNNKEQSNTSVQTDIMRNSIPLTSKREFIETWLLNHSNVAFDHSENRSNCSSSSSIVSNSPKSKRMLRSPLKSLREIKRFKSHDYKNKSPSLINSHIDIGSTMQSKENQIVNTNDEEIDKFSRDMNSENITKISNIHVSYNLQNKSLNHQLPDCKLQSCRVAICGVSRKFTEESVNVVKEIKSADYQSLESCKIKSYQSPICQTINKDISLSPNITDVESYGSSPQPVPIEDSNDCESLTKFEVQSLSQVPNVRIDMASSDTVDENQEFSDSDKDKSISDIIDEADPNLPISINTSDCEIASTSFSECPSISPASSYDSDDTFFSKDDSLNQTIIEHNTNIPLSQKISQDYLSPRNSDVNIGNNNFSSGKSLSLRSIKLENYPVISNVTNRTKKKPKKGSLSGRLHTLITAQTSFLRIWRHQMTHSTSEIIKKQYIILKITHCGMQYNRQYFTGLLIRDTYNLLDKVLREDECLTSNTPYTSIKLQRKIVTILIAHEIVGAINIRENSALEIYPPWEVIDTKKVVLGVLYFRIVNNNNDTTEEHNAKGNNEILQQFNCPCLTAKHLVESCQIKFTNVKPKIIQYLFDD